MGFVQLNVPHVLCIELQLDLIQRTIATWYYLIIFLVVDNVLINTMLVNTSSITILHVLAISHSSQGMLFKSNHK